MIWECQSGGVVSIQILERRQAEFLTSWSLGMLLNSRLDFVKGGRTLQPATATGTATLILTVSSA